MLGKPGGVPPFYNGAIAQSALFNANSASHTTDAGSYPVPGDGDHLCISLWFKRGAINASNQALLGGYYNANNWGFIRIMSTDQLMFQNYYGGTNNGVAYGSYIRDHSNWYHLFLKWDLDGATNPDKISWWLNGVQDVLNITDAPANWCNIITWNATNHFSLGKNPYYNYFFDGYLADVYVLSENLATHNDFGEFKNGTWIPKTKEAIEAAITYGTCGGHWDFADSSDFGKDISGNANHLTDVNLGTDHQMLDTPENNHAVLNKMEDYGNYHYIYEGGLWVQTANSYYMTANSTFEMLTGKWYCEFKSGGGYNMCGIIEVNDYYRNYYYPGFYLGGIGYYYVNGNKYVAGVSTSYGDPYTTNDVIGMAYDADAGTLHFYKNGADQGEITVARNHMPKVFGLGDGVSDSYGTGTFNFGQRPFDETPPEGYLALCSMNLPEPDIIDPRDAIEVVGWDGNSTNPRDITGLNFSPDFVWLKCRDSAQDHHIYDVDRGVLNALFPHDTYFEQTSLAGKLTAFLSNGFTVDAGTNDDNAVNDSAYKYYALCLKKGAAYGFDIATWIANGGTSGQAINHSLGAPPEIIVYKNRDAGGTGWPFYHHLINLGVNPEQYQVLLNTNAIKSDTTDAWYDTPPTSTQFTVGDSGTLPDADRFVAFLWRSIPGFSRCFSYVGYNSVIGPYVHCGFRPRWILFKRSESSGSWMMIDTFRDVDNPCNTYMLADESGVEGLSIQLDIVSNGFKMRLVTSSNITHMGIAFADQPFKYSNSR